MARAIPALPVVPAEPRRFAPRLPILSGQGTVPADDVGHWRDMAREINLSLATGNASVVFECNYPDNQFWVASVGFLFRTRFAMPPLSGYHTAVRISVYGNTPAAGTVRFRSTNGAGLVDIIMPGVVGWTDSVAPHLPVAFAGLPLYEEVTIETDGNCQVDIIKVEYLDINPGGFWPALDDALPAGPVPGSAFGANPMDDAEVGPDKPLSAGVGLNALRNLQDIEERERVYLNIAAFNPGIVGGVDAVMGTFPHRVVVPVLGEREPPIQLTLAVYAEATAGAFEFYVSGRGGVGISANPPTDSETFALGVGFGSWRFFTFELSAGQVHEAPRHYAGLTTLSVKPELALALQHVKSVAMWSR